MSVHQESLDVVKPLERRDNPPELEYSVARNESLTMFGSAIGGAVLGMLLTLLVLAIINGGTLSFSGGERLDVMEASVTRIDENVGAVSSNVNVVAEQAQSLQDQLVAAESSLRQALETGQGDMTELQEAVDSLDQSTALFTGFLVAMDEALTEIKTQTAEGEAVSP